MDADSGNSKFEWGAPLDQGSLLEYPNHQYHTRDDL